MILGYLGLYMGLTEDLERVLGQFRVVRSLDSLGVEFLLIVLFLDVNFVMEFKNRDFLFTEMQCESNEI